MVDGWGCWGACWGAAEWFGMLLCWGECIAGSSRVSGMQVTAMRSAVLQELVGLTGGVALPGSDAG